MVRAAALACVLAACGTGPPSPGRSGASTTSTSPPTTADPVGPAPAPPPTAPCDNLVHIGRSDPVLARELEARAVRPERLEGRVLYAWVSAAQADVMRRGRVLL